MKGSRSETGRSGEQIACSYLESMGHVILERNWRTGHLEIDIVSRDGAGIHFVEVKTRRPPLVALPQDNVGHAKQQKLARAALAYLNTVGGVGNSEDCHFDVMGVLLDDENHSVEWVPDAFFPIFV
ncbi:MAG: YraN family protein [Bacteroidales bacterium]|nr:YraN family protein [Bacteroidales bacterium]